MNVPEQFIVYQIIKAPNLGAPVNPPPTQWVEVPKKNYDLFKGEKRRLAILPLFHVHVRKWFSPANGWYCTLDVRDGTKQVFKTGWLNTDGDQGWVGTLIVWLHTQNVVKMPIDLKPNRCGTKYLREELNIDYDVTEVQRKADL